MRYGAAGALRIGCCAALAIASFGRSAAAHQVGISRGEYAFSGTELAAELTFARGELISLAPTLDADGDGKLSQAELDAGSAALAAVVVARVDVRAGGGACTGVLVGSHLTEEDGAAVRARYRCKAADSAHVTLTVLEDLAPGHRHIARARGKTNDVEEVLFRNRPSLDVPIAREGAFAAILPDTAAPAAPIANDRAPKPADRGSFAAGAIGTLRAWESIAALFAVTVASAWRRDRFVASAAFVAAAIFGACLSTAGLFAPNTHLVGVAAALTLVYLGVDGALTARQDAQEPQKTAWWRLADVASIGALHGLAIAAPAADSSFVVGAALTLIAALGVSVVGARVIVTPSLGSRGVVAASALVAIAGAGLACARLWR